MMQGIDNIGICTSDLARSVAFYQELGLTEAYRNDRGVMMGAGTGQLFLFQTRRPDPAPVGRELGLFDNPLGIDHISFAVTDVDALYAKLSKAGVAFAQLHLAAHEEHPDRAYRRPASRSWPSLLRVSATNFPRIEERGGGAAAHQGGGGRSRARVADARLASGATANDQSPRPDPGVRGAVRPASRRRWPHP
jgi:hypothetical protein